MGKLAATDARVAFTDELTLRTVRDARDRLAEVYAGGQSIEIDCAALTDCDLSGAQLIVAALKSAERDGKRVRVVPPTSGVLTRTLSRAGLTEAYEELAAACARARRKRAVK